MPPARCDELGLALDAGRVPFFCWGRFGWRRRSCRQPRCEAAIEAVFRTDLALKSSGGDPRILLERLVVELCGNASR